MTRKRLTRATVSASVIPAVTLKSSSQHQTDDKENQFEPKADTDEYIDSDVPSNDEHSKSIRRKEAKMAETKFISSLKNEMKSTFNNAVKSETQRLDRYVNLLLKSIPPNVLQMNVLKFLELGGTVDAVTTALKNEENSLAGGADTGSTSKTAAVAARPRLGTTPGLGGSGSAALSAIQIRKQEHSRRRVKAPSNKFQTPSLSNQVPPPNLVMTAGSSSLITPKVDVTNFTDRQLATVGRKQRRDEVAFSSRGSILIKGPDTPENIRQCRLIDEMMATDCMSDDLADYREALNKLKESLLNNQTKK